jgi:hypothetical protein
MLAAAFSSRLSDILDRRRRTNAHHLTRCGRICLGGRKINLSAAFAGQNVGIRKMSEKIWPVSFMQ